MYLEHFGLNEPPFRITPHTDFFFAGAGRGATLDALLYAILNDEGIVKVIGEVGSGKTMLCRVLIERLPPSVDSIYIATPSLGSDEILHAIADELKLALPDGRVRIALRELQDRLIGLYAQGRRVVILIDEAHAMPEETLEQIRLLSNLESNRHKLLQIVLFGQPELDDVLVLLSLRQLKDRVTHGFSMRPLAEPEVGKYVAFRMQAAGYRGPDVFAPRAIGLIARASQGLTRRINILADKSLLAAFAADTHAVTERQARAAIADSEFARVGRRRTSPAAVVAALAAGVVIGAAAFWAFAPRDPGAGAPQPPVEPRSALASVAVTPAAPTQRKMLTAEQTRKLSGYVTGDYRLLTARIAAAVERLDREPDERYGIELFFSENSDPARLERFLSRAHDLAVLEELYVVPVESRGGYRIRVFFGVFENRAAALEAANRLPSKYKEAFSSSARSFAELRRPL